MPATDPHAALTAIAALPVGRWAVGVSGGADSVALLRLLAGRGNGSVVVAHLNHHLRSADSDADAVFVQRLGERLNVPVEIGHLGASKEITGKSEHHARQIAPNNANTETPRPPRNPSARYRAARFAFFAAVVARHRLDGVVLAHHADDQAETVLLQLRRGRGLAFLGGIAPHATINGLPIHRPLLGVSRQALRDYLSSIGQPWREDASNASTRYRRNVLRQWLAERPALTPMLLRLADASRRWRATLDVRAPRLDESFSCDALRVPPPLAEHAARRWLTARGAPHDRVSPAI
ncbi:MAG TPA: tRNA lysidine(34) synthetase TilS, partial [Tepidisphaeraceae bacterium]